MCWSWGTELGHHLPRPHKESPGVADTSSNQCAWGSITFEETVLGDTVETAPLGFFLHCFF